MCDFRSIKQITLSDGTIINITKDIKKRCRVSGAVGIDIPIINEIIEPGWYSVAASGGWSFYFDGKNHLREGVDYEVSEFTHYHGGI